MRCREIAKEDRAKYVSLRKKFREWYFFVNGMLKFFVVPIMSYFRLLYDWRLVTEAVQKMKGKIPEIAGSHISSRVLQVY